MYIHACISRLFLGQDYISRLQGARILPVDGVPTDVLVRLAAMLMSNELTEGRQVASSRSKVQEESL